MAKGNEIRVGNIRVLYNDKESRVGTIVFGSPDSVDGDVGELNDYLGTGWEFYAKKRTFEDGSVVFGGFVSYTKLSKEDRPEAHFYLKLSPYTGSNENIVYTLTLTEYNGEFGAVIASGMVFSSQLKGVSNGFVFYKPVEEEEEAPKSRKNSGRSGGAGKRTSKTSSTRSKPAKQMPDEDEVPF